MVRQVKPVIKATEAEMKSRRRNTIAHPPDNIGVSCTVQSNNSEEKILPGRRRSLVVPRDNIGVACLPTAERLDNIVELPEYDSSDEEIEKKTTLKVSKNRRSPLPHSTVRARTRMNRKRDDDVIDANRSTTSSNESDKIAELNSRYERGRSCKRRDTVGLLWQESGKETSKKFTDSKKSDPKFGEMGISNVRRPREDPTKPRKPILPRDNIGFACKPLHKSSGRLMSGSRLSTGVNFKNSSHLVERKNFLHGKSPMDETRNEETTREQIDTLRTSDMRKDVDELPGETRYEKPSETRCGRK